ncbi:MAG: TlpA family protein disulfide reductase [Atopobiaceae bacterium]|nr:TlpA family protein disulfide reductase [Atopobiaceae bacterium]
MKSVKTFGKTAAITITAGALCASLLAGCGSATLAPVADPSTSQHFSSTQEATEGIAADEAPTGTTDYDSELMESVSNYASLSSFAAKTLDGKTFTQDDLAKADVTLINFWGVYCPYCLDEMPEIAAWAKTLPKNVQVITVCTDYDSDPQSAAEVIEDAGLACPTLVGGTGDFAQLSTDVMYLPTTLVVDSTGKVIGDVLEGAPQNIGAAYGQMINAALKAQGKAPTNA